MLAGHESDCVVKGQMLVQMRKFLVTGVCHAAPGCGDYRVPVDGVGSGGGDISRAHLASLSAGSNAEG